MRLLYTNRFRSAVCIYTDQGSDTHVKEPVVHVRVLLWIMETPKCQGFQLAEAGHYNTEEGLLRISPSPVSLRAVRTLIFLARFAP